MGGREDGGEQSRTGARSSLSTASSLGSITPGGRCVQRWVAGNLAPIASVSHSAPGCPPTNQSPARGDQVQDPVTLGPGFRAPPRTCCEPSPRRPQVKTVPVSTRTHAARPPAEPRVRERQGSRCSGFPPATPGAAVPPRLGPG